MPTNANLMTDITLVHVRGWIGLQHEATKLLPIRPPTATSLCLASPADQIIEISGSEGHHSEPQSQNFLLAVESTLRS